jgi:hypothetical protein
MQITEGREPARLTGAKNNESVGPGKAEPDSLGVLASTLVVPFAPSELYVFLQVLHCNVVHLPVSTRGH